MTQVITIAAEKGGVGKTTVTLTLAAAYADAGCRVLLIDADPQGNLTTSLNDPEWPAETAGLGAVLTPHSTTAITDVTRPTVWPNVHITPPGPSLDAIGMVLSAMLVGGDSAAVEGVLDDAITAATASSIWDVVLIDTRPSLDMLTRVSLVAATDVLVVAQPHLFGVDATTQLLDTVGQVRESAVAAGRRGPRVAGVLVNHISPASTKVSKEYAGQIERAVAGRVPILGSVPPRAAIAQVTTDGVALSKGDPGRRDLHKGFVRVASLLSPGLVVEPAPLTVVGVSGGWVR